MTESVMVLIPLLITFLSVLQLSTGVMARTVSNNIVQGRVAQLAIVGNASSSGYSNSNSNSNSNQSTPGSLQSVQIDLPGGGSLTLGTQLIHNPAVSPLLPSGDNFLATGIAVNE